MATIIIADNPLNEISIAKELLPPSLDAVVARHGSPEFKPLWPMPCASSGSATARWTTHFTSPRPT